GAVLDLQRGGPGRLRQRALTVQTRGRAAPDAIAAVDLVRVAHRCDFGPVRGEQAPDPAVTLHARPVPLPGADRLLLQRLPAGVARVCLVPEGNGRIVHAPAEVDHPPAAQAREVHQAHVQVLHLDALLHELLHLLLERGDQLRDPFLAPVGLGSMPVAAHSWGELLQGDHLLIELLLLGLDRGQDPAQPGNQCPGFLDGEVAWECVLGHRVSRSGAVRYQASASGLSVPRAMMRASPISHRRPSRWSTVRRPPSTTRSTGQGRSSSVWTTNAVAVAPVPQALVNASTPRS